LAVTYVFEVLKTSQAFWVLPAEQVRGAALLLGFQNTRQTFTYYRVIVGHENPDDLSSRF
jgi:hypothetical protein